MGTHGLELLPYTNQSSWTVFFLILLGQRLQGPYRLKYCSNAVWPKVARSPLLSPSPFRMGIPQGQRHKQMSPTAAQ